MIALALLISCQRTDERQHPEPPAFTNPVPEAPGSRPLQRLNRAEYDATVKALLGTTQTPGRSFPADEIVDGFDNIASALTTTSIHVELWEEAADGLVDELFGLTVEETSVYGAQAEGAGVTYEGQGSLVDTEYMVFDGAISVPFSLAADGTFAVRVAASGRTAGGVGATMDVRVDGTSVLTTTLGGSPGTYTAQTVLTTGTHLFEVSIANPGGSPGGQQRAVIVDWIEVEGPLDPETGRSAAYDRFVPCAPDGKPSRECAAEALALFGREAWRRPLSEEDIAWALGLYDTAVSEGEEPIGALAFAFKGVLMAPEFLYRIEQDPPAGEPVKPLDGYEVAARLAAFVWSANPDSVLLDAAEDGSLLAPGGIESQLDRMLADPRAQALVDNLAGQWFDIRALDKVAPDPTLYPAFDEALRASMREGLVRTAQGFFRGEVAFDQLLLQETGFVDARLAAHYGLAPPATGWAEVDLPGRPGLFGNAGWLTAQAHPDRPSAVRRGKWILDQLLCSPPPPPPPDVEGVFQPEEGQGSIREQEEATRSDELCQSCHGVMDPMGYALGGFDAIGAVRTVDELGAPIDTKVEIDGTTIVTPYDLATFVAADPRLHRCAVRKTLTYALGRTLTDDDDPAVADATRAFEEGGLTFRALAMAVATSAPFLWRQGPAAVEGE